MMDNRGGEKLALPFTNDKSMTLPNFLFLGFPWLDLLIFMFYAYRIKLRMEVKFDLALVKENNAFHHFKFHLYKKMKFPLLFDVLILQGLTLSEVFHDT